MSSSFPRFLVSGLLSLVLSNANAVIAKDLILQTLQGNDPAEGVLSGPAADQISRATQSTAPIRVKATRIQQLRQEGCWRVRVTFSQDNAMTVGGSRRPFVGGYDLNVCEGGDAPFPQ